AILLAALVLVGVWRTLPRYRPASARARTRAARFEQASAGSRSLPGRSGGTNRATGAQIPSGAAGPVELQAHGKREAIGAEAAPTFRTAFELPGEPHACLPRLLVALDRAPHFRIASTNEEGSELTAEYRTIWTEGNLKVKLAPNEGRTLLT